MKFSDNSHLTDLSSYMFYGGLATDSAIESPMQLFPSSCS